eukprot:9168309-Heterocapsa_arctica.AAC.1
MEFVGRYKKWMDWYQHSFYKQLKDALEEANKLGINPRAEYDKLLLQLKECKDPKASAEGALEGSLYRSILCKRYAISHRSRLSLRLSRWKIDRPIGTVTEGAVVIIHRLSSLVPPMVTAAAIRTFRNGWVTARRCAFFTPAT